MSEEHAEYHVNGDGAPSMGATSASEFRRTREQGELVTIPTTGRKVRMRIVKPSALLRLGKIPDVLSELVVRIMYGQITDKEYNQFFALPKRKEEALEVAESLRVVCTAALLAPRIVDDPQTDDEIHIDDLEDNEQRIIFNLAMLEASGLSKFCHQQNTDVEAVGPEQEATPETEQPA